MFGGDEQVSVSCPRGVYTLICTIQLRQDSYAARRDATLGCTYESANEGRRRHNRQNEIADSRRVPSACIALPTCGSPPIYLYRPDATDRARASLSLAPSEPAPEGPLGTSSYQQRVSRLCVALTPGPSSGYPSEPYVTRYDTGGVPSALSTL
jgi:hypothetical protein